MWPAALGGTYSSWGEKLHGFRFGHEQRKYFALVGSPVAAKSMEGFASNYAASTSSGFLLPATQSGTQTHFIAIAGSMENQQAVEGTYQTLLKQAAMFEAEGARYYRDYLQRPIRLTLPDDKLQK